MPTRLRLAALHLALAAMMLRALLPAGWMPNPAGFAESLFVICTADGPIWPIGQSEHRHHTPDDRQQSHEACPFAAAPHVAGPAILAQIDLLPLLGRLSDPPATAMVVRHRTPYQPQAPRAPPLFS